MANPAWPSGLPQYVLQSGYREEKQDQVLRSNMEGGATKSRRRFTARFDLIDVRMRMSSEQAAQFENFYETTLKGGALNFDWIHPRRRTVKAMQIIGKVSISAADGDNFDVAFKVEIKP